MLSERGPKRRMITVKLIELGHDKLGGWRVQREALLELLDAGRRCFEGEGGCGGAISGAGAGVEGGDIDTGGSSG